MRDDAAGLSLSTYSPLHYDLRHAAYTGKFSFFFFSNLIFSFGAEEEACFQGSIEETEKVEDFGGNERRVEVLR